MAGSGAHESRLLAVLLGLLASASIAIPRFERFRSTWSSAPAVLHAALASARATIAGLATFGAIELAVRTAGTLSAAERTVSDVAILAGLVASVAMTLAPRASAGARANAPDA